LQQVVQKNMKKNSELLYFSATCCRNAVRWLANSCLHLVVYVS